MNAMPMGVPAPESYAIPASPEAGDNKPIDTSAVVMSLANHIRGKWQEAKQHREQSGVDAQIMRSKRAGDRQYEPNKLQEIRDYEKNQRYDPPYDPIIDVKCRALQAKMSSRILAPGDRPWSISPTPIPDLPDDVKQGLERIVALTVTEQAMQQGNAPAIDDVEQQKPDIEAQVLAMMTKLAKEANESATQRLDDQLREGGWYEAVKKCIYDFTRMPASILKGPILKKRNKLSHQFGPTGWTTSITEERIDTWERVAPVKIYQEPHSKGVNDGYLIELSSYKRRDLYNAIGIEGYDEKAIRQVLNTWQSGGLHEWTLLDTEKALLEKKSTITLGNDIDCLIFWGSAPGNLLITWGMKADVITDPDREYDIWAELIGSEVIMARLNPDPLSEKPYHKASLIEDPDRFWNASTPDLLWDIAMLCCAVLRACGVNAAFSSGPIMDIAVDQLENRNDTALYPRRVIRRTSKMMNDLRQVVNFYQPQLMTGPLSQFLEFCHTLCDEWSGIMRIAHGGDATGTGADSTASGMSMNITESSQGVKFSLSNFDDGIIGPSVSKQYHINLYENKDGAWSSPYLDPKIVATGSSASSLMAKEQQSMRRNEFSTSLSPEEKQIMGPEGLKELLKQKILALDMDPDKLLPEDRQRIQQLTGLQMPGAVPGEPGQSTIPEAETVNAAGDKSGGRDLALPMYPKRAGARASTVPGAPA